MKLPLSSILVLALAASTFAGPLREATVNQIVNDVQVVDPSAGARRAVIQEKIKDDLGLTTGAQSRAELLFQDQTLTRLGAESFFSFKPGTRDLKLDRGTMLLQVPKGLGGARIRAASVTASITGTTILMEYTPQKHLKVLVLEGSLRLAINGRLGETLLLLPGRMVIMNPNDKRLPNPVAVDLQKVIRTSSLIGGSSTGRTASMAPLPSLGLIEKEIAQQSRLTAQKELIATNLVIPGKGTQVVVASETMLAALDNSTLRDNALVAAEVAPIKIIGEPAFNPPDKPSPTGGGNIPIGTDPGTGTGTTPATGTGTRTFEIINAESLPSGQPLIRAGRAGTAILAPEPGGLVELRSASKLEFTSGKINGARFDGGDALLTLTHEGGDGGTLLGGTAANLIPDEIIIDIPITATTGANSATVAHGGAGGTVELISAKKVILKSRIEVSSDVAGRRSRAGGNVRLESRLSGGIAIAIENSGQILSLLDAAAPGPGGTIRFNAPSGEIHIKDSTVRADRGTIDIRNGGNNQIYLENATLRGDVVKVGALGANGQLVIKGGAINADTALKLYGGTTNGSVQFSDNVTLGGAGTKIIAGKTVTIDDGRTVTVGGSNAATVHTDRPNYTGSGGNGSKSGRFGGAGATTRPHNTAPAF